MATAPPRPVGGWEDVTPVGDWEDVAPAQPRRRRRLADILGIKSPLLTGIAETTVDPAADLAKEFLAPEGSKPITTLEGLRDTLERMLPTPRAAVNTARVAGKLFHGAQDAAQRQWEKYFDTPEEPARPMPDMVDLLKTARHEPMTAVRQFMDSPASGYLSEKNLLPSEKNAHALAALLPFIGPAAADAGELYGTDPARAAGQTLGLVGTAALPLLAKSKEAPIEPRQGPALSMEEQLTRMAQERAQEGKTVKLEDLANPDQMNMGLFRRKPKSEEPTNPSRREFLRKTPAALGAATQVGREGALDAAAAPAASTGTGMLARVLEMTGRYDNRLVELQDIEAQASKAAERGNMDLAMRIIDNAEPLYREVEQTYAELDSLHRAAKTGAVDMTPEVKQLLHDPPVEWFTQVSGHGAIYPDVEAVSGLAEQAGRTGSEVRAGEPAPGRTLTRQPMAPMQRAGVMDKRRLMEFDEMGLAMGLPRGTLFNKQLVQASREGFETWIKRLPEAFQNLAISEAGVRTKGINDLRDLYQLHREMDISGAEFSNAAVEPVVPKVRPEEPLPQGTIPETPVAQAPAPAPAAAPTVTAPIRAKNIPLGADPLLAKAKKFLEQNPNATVRDLRTALGVTSETRIATIMEQVRRGTQPSTLNQQLRGTLKAVKDLKKGGGGTESMGMGVKNITPQSWQSWLDGLRDDQRMALPEKMPEIVSAALEVANNPRHYTPEIGDLISEFQNSVVYFTNEFHRGRALNRLPEKQLFDSAKDLLTSAAGGTDVSAAPFGRGRMTLNEGGGSALEDLLRRSLGRSPGQAGAAAVSPAAPGSSTRSSMPGPVPLTPAERGGGVAKTFVERFLENTPGGQGPFKNFREKQQEVLQRHVESTLGSISEHPEVATKQYVQKMKTGLVPEVQALKAKLSTTPEMWQAVKAEYLGDMFTNATTYTKGGKTILKGHAMRKVLDLAGEPKLKEIFTPEEMTRIKAVIDTADKVGHTPRGLGEAIYNYFFYKGLIAAGTAGAFTAAGVKGLATPIAIMAINRAVSKAMLSPWGSKVLVNWMKAVGRAGPAVAQGSRATFWTNRLGEVLGYDNNLGDGSQPSP